MTMIFMIEFRITGANANPLALQNGIYIDSKDYLI